MDNSPKNESFISGIYNYCDRWCERCRFADRCRVFAKEQEWPDDDDDMESVIRVVGASLAEAKQMLIEKAEEFGIDPFAISNEEYAEIHDREKAFVNGDELSQLADRYWPMAKEILESDFPRDDEQLTEILSVLGWYLFFIPVKVKCGLNGLLDHDGFEDESHRIDAQSYANGTVKIALIGIERSLLAWHQLSELGCAARTQPAIELLKEILVKLDERFPLARNFIRPGFDELEMVM